MTDEVIVSAQELFTVHAAAVGEALAIIAERDARIAELEKMLAVHRLAVDVDALKARIAELRAALKPFARMGEYVSDKEAWPDNDKMWIDCIEFEGDGATCGDLRAARAALGEKE